MLKALYTSATGMRAQQLNVDVVANNLANISTTGFKRSQCSFEDLLYVIMTNPGAVSAEGYEIPTGCPAGPWACPNGRRGDGRYSIRAAAEALNVSESTISNWCLSGRLDSTQAVPGSPRWIKLTSEDIAALRKPVRRTLHSRRKDAGDILSRLGNLVDPR